MEWEVVEREKGVRLVRGSLCNVLLFSVTSIIIICNYNWKIEEYTDR